MSRHHKAGLSSDVNFIELCFHVIGRKTRGRCDQSAPLTQQLQQTSVLLIPVSQKYSDEFSALKQTSDLKGKECPSHEEEI